MSERQKQAEFIKTLLSCPEVPQHEDLNERIKGAERDERCMKRACRLVLVIAMMALSVLGYLTILKTPDDMTRLTQAALRFSQALALGSAMCLGVFFGLLLWHRALINRLYAEGRKIITLQLKHQQLAPTSASSTVVVHDGDTAVYHIRTQAQPNANADIITLPKMS